MVETLKLVVQAEAVLADLMKHQTRVAAFLDRAGRYSDQAETEGDHGAR